MGEEKEKPCYLCAPNPPIGTIKPKDRYYCPECAANMAEAEIIREAFVQAKKDGKVGPSKIPQNKQVKITPARMKREEWYG